LVDSDFVRTKTSDVNPLGAKELKGGPKLLVIDKHYPGVV